MARRGRPKHPDILTPREWDVLALLREGLTNEQIAQRLGITERTAKFHVSEILSKLGVGSREEAAAWQPEERRPWWLAAGAPLSFVWRKTAGAAGHGVNAMGVAIGGAMFAAVIAGIVLLSVMLARGSDHAAAPQEARIAFSAGGSIYTVRPDGSDLKQVIAADRQSGGNSAPALSPDGTRIAFARDFDIWTATTDGHNIRRLASVAELQTPPDNAASNFSLGANAIVWSPDGAHIAYVMGRIGGSGVQNVWLMRDNGGDRTEIYPGGAGWLKPVWLDSERITFYDSPGQVRVFRTSSQEGPAIALPAEQRPSLVAEPGADGRWLVGPITKEGPIAYGPPDALRQVATGISPTLSPDRTAFAYFTGDTIHIAAIDGHADKQIVDLAPLGGSDCARPNCIYPLPQLSWVGVPSESGEATPTIPVPSGTQTSIAQVRSIVSVFFAGDATRIESLLRFTRVPCTEQPVGPGAPPQCRPGEAEGTPVEVFPVGRCEGAYARPDALQDVISALANPGPQFVSVYEYHPIDSNPNPFFYGDFVAVATIGGAPAPRYGGGVWIGNGGITGVHLGCAQTPSEFEAFFKLQNPLDLGP